MDTVFRSLLFSAILPVWFSAPAGAVPILLVEFNHRVATVEFGDPLSATVPFGFSANDPSPLNYVNWQEEYGLSDVGMTFIAPREIVDGANQAIASPTTRYHLTTGPANFSDEASQHLLGNTVTSVERIIDQLVITRTQGEFYFLEAAQRIQIWGVAVPEPPAILLLGLGIGYYATLRFATRRLRST